MSESQIYLGRHLCRMGEASAKRDDSPLQYIWNLDGLNNVYNGRRSYEE